jgi:hypothetical protein
LAEFLIGKCAFQFVSPSYLVGILPYVPSIVGKEMKTNFLPVLYIRMPSEQGLTPKEHTLLAKARAGIFQGEWLTWMALPHSKL